MLFCYPSFRCNFLKVFRTNNGNVGTCIISTNTCAGTPATSATTFLDWLSLSLTHTTPTILSLESEKVCPWGEVFLHRHDSLHVTGCILVLKLFSDLGMLSPLCRMKVRAMWPVVPQEKYLASPMHLNLLSHSSTLKTALDKQAATFGCQWDNYLSGVLFVYWNTPHNSTGVKISSWLYRLTRLPNTCLPETYTCLASRYTRSASNVITTKAIRAAGLKRYKVH